jgi:TRAP-type mannitol/chloroaromatic compound transport system permease small subunit
MRIQRFATLVLGLGVLVLSAAVFWSLSTYGAVGSRLISQGLRPTVAIHCLYGFSDPCALITSTARERGAMAYTPLLFWLGVVLFPISMIINAIYGGTKGERDTAAARLQRLLIPVDQISTFVGHSFAWCIVLLTAAVSYEVFSRYVLGRPTTWAFDASYILYGALFIMAGAYALCRNAHVRGDFLYRKWRPKVQATLDLVLYFLFFFPGVLAFIYSGYGYAAQAWMTHEHSAFSPQGPPIYHYKTLIPITGILLLMQGVVEVIRCIVCIRTGKWPRRLHDVEELDVVILEQQQKKSGGKA